MSAMVSPHLTGSPLFWPWARLLGDPLFFYRVSFTELAVLCFFGVWLVGVTLSCSRLAGPPPFFPGVWLLEGCLSFPQLVGPPPPFLGFWPWGDHFAKKCPSSSPGVWLPGVDPRTKFCNCPPPPLLGSLPWGMHFLKFAASSSILVLYKENR